MSNLFKSVREIIDDEQPLDSFLLNASSYRAHRHPTEEPESLEEHIKLVNSYFTCLVQSNGLDTVIDNLINGFLLENEVANERLQLIGNVLKNAFVQTVVFHDFGKINPNFQGDKDKMDNLVFKSKMIPDYVLKTHHSKLSAYIYLVKHFKDIALSGIKSSEQQVILLFIFFLSYPIIKHHAIGLDRIDKNGIAFRKEELEAMEKYLAEYQIMLPAKLSVLATDIFSEKMLEQKFYNPFESKLIKGNFPLYALTKLNFSLLTASDYLATSEYMNQKKITDLGLVGEELRGRIIHAAQHSHSYNTEAFELADTDEYLHNPIAKSAENLNILRRNMAVQVIRMVRRKSNKRIFYLEAPTGGGKTNLSMLAIAELLKVNPEINKVFYVFPFTTLITQTHKAILQTLDLKEDEVAVLHAKAGFQTKVEDDCYGNQKLDYLNNLFVHYPFCLLTHIRFFDVLKTNEKETNYLLHRLGNSIVIIDELQSYAPQHWDKMLYFIQQYAEAFNVRFILMSATLPRIDKLKLNLSNKMPFTDLLPNARDYFTNVNFAERVQFKFDYRNDELEMSDLAKIVLAKSEEYALQNENGSVFTIVEFIFKKSAAEFYQAIGNFFFEEIFVLSGTILEPRRKEIINYLKNPKNRDNKVLLITTQVVEAGVDIDMDLGFKNVSLIDSDEQLAGRVNRNVKKGCCEVYLFHINEPSLLYKKDYRYSITREQISKEEHAEILKEKNFEKLYNLVISRIDKINGLKELQNFNSDYLPEIQRLNYKEVHKKFQLIEQESLSVFVPLHLPKNIPSANDKEEAIFTEKELKFLSGLRVNTGTKSIDGIEVWRAYKSILYNKEKKFIEQQVDKKIMAGILSKFTFSVFVNEKIKSQLKSFGFPADDKENELRGFDNYIYLAHHDKCYDYKKGLVEKQFEASDNFIL